MTRRDLSPADDKNQEIVSIILVIPGDDEPMILKRQTVSNSATVQKDMTFQDTYDEDVSDAYKSCPKLKALWRQRRQFESWDAPRNV